MLSEAIIAYLHYLSIIGVISTLVFEWVLFKKKLSATEARLLQKIDSLYGLSSILVVGTGLVRAFYFGKGSQYYFGNYIFLTKLGLFIVIGLLSIYPTRLFIRWRKELKMGAEFIDIETDKASKTRIIIRLEVILIFLLPLLAALMARGFGY